MGENISHAHRDWQVQKVAWAVWAVVLIAGLIGWLGSGPLSHSVAGTQDSTLWVEYERFGRRRAETSIKVHARSSAPGKARIWISTPYLQTLDVSRITPEPQIAEAAGERMVFEFAVSAPEFVVVFEVQPKRFGRLSGQIGLEGGSQVSLSQFIYP